MDLASALDELPEVHAVVLRLHRAGTDAVGIAAELGIEVEAVAPLLRVAKAKLARLLAAPDPSGEGGTRHTGDSENSATTKEADTMTTSSPVSDLSPGDLGGFRASTAEAVFLRLIGAGGTDTLFDIRYEKGIFTLRLGPVGSGAVPHFVRLLGPKELPDLLDALRNELDQPPVGVDVGALRAFVAVLSETVDAQRSHRFDQARFASISKDPSGALVAHLGIGVDVAGTVHDLAGSISFEQHPFMLPPGAFHVLGERDRVSLAAALEAFLDATPTADPLWRQLLTDL